MRATQSTGATSAAACLGVCGSRAARVRGPRDANAAVSPAEHALDLSPQNLHLSSAADADAEQVSAQYPTLPPPLSTLLPPCSADLQCRRGWCHQLHDQVPAQYVVGRRQRDHTPSALLLVRVQHVQPGGIERPWKLHRWGGGHRGMAAVERLGCRGRKRDQGRDMPTNFLWARAFAAIGLAARTAAA